MTPAEGSKAATFLNNENATNQNCSIINNKIIYSLQNQQQSQQYSDLLLPPISTMLLSNNDNNKALISNNYNLYNQYDLHSKNLYNTNTAKISVEKTKTTDNADTLININEKNFDNTIENNIVNRQSKNLWKIFSASGGCVLRLIETNSKKANWMKNVRLAMTKESQNLVACQVFFLKIFLLYLKKKYNIFKCFFI